MCSAVIIAGCALGFSGCDAAPAPDARLARATPAAQTQLLQSVGIEQKLDRPVPLDLEFLDETGRRVTLGDFACDDDRPVLLNLVYYECPMLCNVALENLVRTLREIEFTPGDEFEIVTVSFDPRETPRRAAQAKRKFLRNYDREEGAAGWHFLTGDEDAIRRLTEAVGFRYRWDDRTQQYAHAAGIMVLTPDGRLSRYLDGVDYPPRDLRLALVEASQRRIGSPTDHVLLFCYQYDPATGKYGLLIHRVIQAAGIATVLALGCGIGLMIRRERRSKSERLTTSDLRLPSSPRSRGRLADH
ncbi:MAG: SCO family protein [Planctomycetaceae bacterium]